MRLSLSVSGMILLVSCMFPFFSCNESNNEPPANVVYYYPQKNVYYDSLKSNYYYSLDGAVTWDSMAFKASAGFGNALGSRITLKDAGDSVWLNNAQHRKQYNGVLINTINSHTIALSKADRINKLKAVVKVATQAAATEKKDSTPPEKGLKKFFHKIFGKKKKPAEDKEP